MACKAKVFGDLQNRQNNLASCEWIKPQAEHAWRCARLCPKNEQTMQQIMQTIEKYVYDPSLKREKVIQIQSYSMRKELQERVKQVYRNTGVFTEISRIHPETLIKKTKSFRQANFLRNIMDLEDMGLGFHDDVISNQEDSSTQQVISNS